MTATLAWDRAMLASNWLASQQQADGSWADLKDPKVEAFYKSSWAFVLTGKPDAAHRVLNYAADNFLTADGDFLPRGNEYHMAVHHTYANAYFIKGSLMSGRFEIAMPATEFVLGQQSPQYGGFYARLTEENGTDRFTSKSSSMGGFACLTAGKIDRARRAADFLADLIEMQPSPQDRFYTTVEADGQLGTEPESDGELWWRVVDTREDNQCWYALGLPFAFLIQLHQATGESKYQELAFWFLDFMSRCVNPWEGPSSGKAGWGCAMLYRITGDTRYRDRALQVADFLGSIQQADGKWTWAALVEGYGEANETELTNSDFDLTAEYTLWLSLMSANILTRDKI